jgi:hypothetical protein
VVNVAPQVQVACVSTYAGWISGFTGYSSVIMVAGSARLGRRCREPEPGSSVPEVGALDPTLL